MGMREETKAFILFLFVVIVTTSFCSYKWISYDERKFLEDNKSFVNIVKKPLKEITLEERIAFINDSNGNDYIKDRISEYLNIEKELTNEEESKKVLKEKQNYFETAKQNTISYNRNFGVFFLILSFAELVVFIASIKELFDT